MSIVSLTPALAAARGVHAEGQDPRQQLEVASEQFEALFLQQILKQMRKAGDVLSAGSMLRSRQGDTMRDFYDEALAEHLATSRQTGIADLLVQQLSGGVPGAQQFAEAGEAAASAPLPQALASVQPSLMGTWQRGVDSVGQLWQRSSQAISGLVDSLIRHESAGDVAAVSHKGARGLMQLMPDTAREMAAKLGLEFDEARLTRDGDYNKRLGVAYLDEMLQRYDGHPALAVAAYNAGPGNVDEWLQRNGDPRTGQVGIEAWVQRIPFEETRNYTRSILHDLRSQGQRAESVSTTPVPDVPAEARIEAGLKGDLPEQGSAAFKPGAEMVAYQDKEQVSALQHQSRSAAFAQPIRIDSKGNLS